MDVITFPKICKPQEVYRFYCIVLMHSQTRRHMINNKTIGDLCFGRHGVLLNCKLYHIDLKFLIGYFLNSFFSDQALIKLKLVFADTCAV